MSISDKFRNLFSGLDVAEDPGISRFSIPIPGDDTEDTDMPNYDEASPVSQFAIYGDTYVPVNQVAPSLPPGAYRVGINPQTGQAIFTPKAIKTDKLVALPDDATSVIMSELKKFWDLKPVFQKYGLTHKRGVLMYGPPGSGKTSTLAQVSSALIKAGGVVFYGDADDMAPCLAQFRKVEPSRPIVVIFEDLDNILRRQGDQYLLPLLDGENSVDGVVFIATTNHLHLIPPRLRSRPSRFDRVVEVGMPSAEARRAYLESRGLELSPRFLEMLVTDTHNMPLAFVKEAAISVHVFGNDYEDTMKRLKAMAFEET